MNAQKADAFSGTFSILAISPDSKFMGIATTSGSTYVGDRVPHVKPRVGVVSTQANTKAIYGIKGLQLLIEGLTPKEALDKLLAEDPEKKRQVAIMDFKRRKAVFTGANAPLYHAQLIKGDYIIIGNLLSHKEVVHNMARQFENSRGNLASRMASVLKVASESGGDRRGEKSAAVIVVGAKKVEVEVKIGVHRIQLKNYFAFLNYNRRGMMLMRLFV